MAESGVMAPAVATQFVQYSNDALDVYYSDESRLQLSACGTAFRYYHPPHAGQHPLHGKKEIQQRTEFATSDFKHKVQDAIEFRNRFAERPFLCRNLILKEHVVWLHADIEEVAWPEDPEDAEVITYPDGSVRLVSADEYAAVTLPSHHQYFTTEILCKISKRERRINPRTQCPRAESAIPSPIGRTSMSQETPQIHDKSAHSQTKTTLDESNATQSVLLGHPNNPQTLRSATPNSTSERQIRHQLGDTVLSNNSTTNQNSIAVEGKWEYVWISQHQSLYDIPKTWEHPLQILLKFVEKHKDNITGNQTSPLHPSDTSYIHKHSMSLPKSPGSNSDSDKEKEHNLSGGSLSESLSTIFSTSGINESRTGESAVSSSERRAVTLQRLLKKDFAGCMFIPSPLALPLNCQALNLHRWRPETIPNDDNDRAEAAYMYGKVKVICCQGVIYRLIWKNPRNVEIYPGDGSIMRSTGLSGHFFSHYIQRPDSVIEKTYSVQTPPPTPPGAPYSIGKLISRAARFLQHLCEESLQTLLHDDPCCWAVKPSDTQPMEPLPTVLLEECNVEGFGHFTAFSNGLIRILFSDRTSLEMSFDFTKRVLGEEGNSDSETVKRYLRRPKPLHLMPGIVRLLLRSGQYYQVDINNPEGYETYIKAAVQWAEWVNSTPSERYIFYKDTIYDTHKQSSIDRELKKIQCFNYIVDNMVVPPNDTRSHCSVGKYESNIPTSVTEPTLVDLGINVSAFPSTSVPPTQDTLSMASIQDVLRQTAAAVADLDKFMKSNMEYKPPT